MSGPVSDLGLEMKFPWRVPADDAISESPHESNDSSSGSEDIDSDEDRDNAILEYVNVWKMQMHRCVSNSMSKLQSKLLVKLRAVERKVARHYASRRSKKFKPASRKTDTAGDLDMQGPSEDTIEGGIRIYQPPGTSGSETEDSKAVDSPIGIRGLSDLIEYMSVPPDLDPDNSRNVDLGGLQCRFERFCAENKRTSARLSPLEVGLRTPLSEAIEHFKSLLEHFVRDMFVITEREHGTIDERQNPIWKFKSMNELMVEYFDPLRIEKESSACKEDNFNFLKERINRHLRDFLSVDLGDVTLID